MDHVKLEHSNITLYTHPEYACKGSRCTIHRMTNHSMRSFPQYWRSDRAIMERICPHGVGHPDPDEYALVSNKYELVHGCDGCCSGAYDSL